MSVEALDGARLAVRAREANDIASIRALAVVLGSPRPEAGTLRAIRAVLYKLEHPRTYPRDEDAWAAHGASRATFCKWKQKIHSLVLSIAIDSLSNADVLEFTAVHAMTPSKPATCLAAASSGLTAEEACALEMTNRDARQILRDHAASYMARSRGDASYEGWIAHLHPENVRLDARLTTEGCEHQLVWQEAICTRDAGAREPTSTCGEHIGLVELSVGGAFALAVLSVDVALSLLDIVLTGAADWAGRLRRALISFLTARGSSTCARASKGVLLPVVIVAAALEAGFKVGSLILRAVGSLTVCIVVGIGGALHGLLSLSPSAGRRASARLHALSPRLRRRFAKLAPTAHAFSKGRSYQPTTSLSEPALQQQPAAAILQPVVGTPLAQQLHMPPLSVSVPLVKAIPVDV